MRFASYLAISLVPAVGWVAEARAQEARQIVIPAGSLENAIAALSRQAGVSVGTSGRLPNIPVKGFTARMDVERALRRILQGSGFIARRVGPSAYRIERAPMASRPAKSRSTQQTVSKPSAPLVEGDVFPDILVTATKRPEDHFQLSYSVATVFPDSLVGTAGHASSDTVVGLANGINKTNMGPGRNRLFIRGVADSAFTGPSQSTVALLLNDARINFDTPDPHLSLIDVERIEILKGPQGPLYGTGVLGGIYRIVSRSPSLNSTSMQVASAIGTTKGGALSHASDAIVNFPVSASFALRAVAYHERVGGWVDNVGRQDEDINTVKTTGGRLSLKWTPQDWTINLLAAGQKLKAADSQYASEGLGPYAHRTNFAEPHTGNCVSTQISAAKDFGNTKLSLSGWHVRHDYSNQYDATFADPEPLQAPAQVYRDEHEHKLFGQEARISESDGRFQWLLGINHLQSDSEMDWGVGVDGEDIDGEDAYFKRQSETSLFGDASFEFVPRLTATAGFRLHESRTEEFERFDDRIARSRDVGFTPSASIAWRPDIDTITWARYSSAIRPGGFNPSAETAPFTFKSDKLQSVELGTRLRRMNGRLTVEASVFALSWRDIQSDILLRSGLIGTANFGRAHNFGGEVLASWKDAWITAEAGATYQHGDIYADESVFGKVDDATLPSIPRFKGYARINALVLANERTSFRLGGAVQYTDKTRLSFDPVLNRETDKYAVFKAFAQIDHQNYRWVLSAENLFNSQADTFGFGNPFSVRQERHRTPVRPRTIMLRFEWSV